MKRTMVIPIVMLIAFALTGCKESTPKEADAEVVTANGKAVGVYDSRIIAFAYWSQEVDGKKRMHSCEDLGMPGQQLGILMHQQVFSYHEPAQALDYIADKLPGVMDQAGVIAVISKWDRDELSKYNVVGSGWDEDFIANNPDIVDLTIELVKLYDPTEKFLTGVKDFEDSKPEPFDTDWLHAEE